MDVGVAVGVLDLVGSVASLALAALVFSVAPRGRVNQLLALYLVMNALTAKQGLLRLNDVGAYNLEALNSGVWLGIPFAYLAFTAHAVDVPWLRPLRGPAVRRAMVVAAVVPLPLMLVLHGSLLGRTPDGAWDLRPPYVGIIRAVSFAVVMMALAASLHAFARATPGTVARRRAAAYALAFGLQDAALAVGFVLGRLPGPVDLVVSIALVASLGLLAVGLLRFQLFDFALRVKLGVQRGTLAAMFLATFVVVAETAQNYLSDNLGYLAGGAAAALLVFALRPLERVASRVADTAMPRVEPTPAYVAFKKLEVYRAAVESAVENDGAIDDRERALLDRLRAKLALEAADARAVEDEVLQQARVTAG